MVTHVHTHSQACMRTVGTLSDLQRARGQEGLSSPLVHSVSSGPRLVQSHPALMVQYWRYSLMRIG